MLTIEAQLVTGRYDAAAADDREAVEWPPHPARLFCALVAGARDGEEQRVLRWLEQLPPPVVLAAEPHIHVSRRAYVVTNARADRGGNQFHPARSNQLSSRVATIPTMPTVRFVWPDALAEPALLAPFRSLAARVPYLGRATGAVVLRVMHEVAEMGRVDGFDRHEPCELAEAERTLRVPYPGYLDALRSAFDAGRPAWELSRSRGYRICRTPTAQRTAAPPSPYADLVILRFVGVQPDGRLATRFTAALRRAVMSRVPDPLPAALHGHDAEGRPHVAFLALPDVGHEHADGHLLGLAVAVPQLPPLERVAVVRGLLGPREEDGRFLLQVPRLGAVTLRYQPGHVRPWGATPERWRKGSRLWIAATPVVLDRYPRRSEVERDIARSCAWAGLPEPADVVLSTEPLQPGAVRLRPPDLPKQVRGRLFRHVALRFDRTVHGPVLLGAGRYLGIGLLSPADSARKAA